MSIWSTATINRFAAEGEREITLKVPCITKRVALNVRAGTSVYNVPSDVVSIRRLTWKGKKLDPKPFIDITQYPLVNPAGISGAFDVGSYNGSGFFVDSSNSIPTGQVPYAYFYSGYGENVVKLFPTPSVSVAAVTTDLYGANIPNAVILEYYAFADVTTGSQRVPAYMARRIIKSFVLFKCYSMEGVGQDLNAAARFKSRFEQQLNFFQTVKSGIFVARMRTRSPEGNYFPTKIGRPRLPVNFGTLVDD